MIGLCIMHIAGQRRVQPSKPLTKPIWKETEMAAINTTPTSNELFPAHVVRSFDKLTAIVTGNAQDYAKAIDRMLTLGKINANELRLIQDVRHAWENGIDDGDYSLWINVNTGVCSNREFRFQEWADSIMEVAYKTEPA
jgi:hypothetical protein